MFAAVQAIDKQKQWFLKQQQCMRCAAKRSADQLRKVAPDDVDGHVSDNESYSPPKVGRTLRDWFCSWTAKSKPTTGVEGIPEAAVKRYSNFRRFRFGALQNLDCKTLGLSFSNKYLIGYIRCGKNHFQTNEYRHGYPEFWIACYKAVEIQ